jgi:hypothetical protein
VTHHLDLDAIVLQEGGHHSRDEGVCVMEAVAWWAGLEHSDRPDCVSPVIGAFLRTWNDDLDNEGRQKLKRFIPLVVGTNTGEEDDERRAWMVTDWMVRVHMPAWLDLAGLHEQATAVRSLPELNDDGWAEARATVEGARDAASAARSAAWSAAESAARSAAWSAARSAARSAAWSAAESAAEERVRPIVRPLQESALELLDQLVAVGAKVPA